MMNPSKTLTTASNSVPLSLKDILSRRITERLIDANKAILDTTTPLAGSLDPLNHNRRN
jgi:hypothetical protein